MLRPLAASALLLVALLPTPSPAFNGHRQGFFLGFGLGPGYHSIDQEWTIIDARYEQDDSGPAFATGIRLGYGFSDQLILSLSITGTSAQANNIDSRILGAPVEENNADFDVSGLGVTYFLRPEAPSLFFGATFGAAHWDDGAGNEFDDIGLAVGVGYELKKNWTIEMDIGWGTPGEEATVLNETIKTEIKGASFGVLFSHIWY
jgi:hypothetical protein